MNAALTRLNKLLVTSVVEGKKEDASVEAKAPEQPKIDDFADFVKELNKIFGKESILKTDSNGSILKVSMARSTYEANQDKFSAQGRDEWVFGNEVALLSVMGDVEPDCVKLYFCRVLTLNSAE